MTTTERLFADIERKRLKFIEDLEREPTDVCMGVEDFETLRSHIYRHLPSKGDSPSYVRGLRIHQTMQSGIRVGILTGDYVPEIAIPPFETTLDGQS